MKFKLDSSYIKGFISASIIAPILVYLIISYGLEPLLFPDVEKEPKLVIIAREPYYFHPDEEVTFNITFENVGDKTASELLIRAYTDSYENKSDYSNIKGYDKIIQVGEITNVFFEFTAPSNWTKFPEWTMKIVATTTDDYDWEFYIKYNYEPDFGVYHITPRTN